MENAGTSNGQSDDRERKSTPFTFLLRKDAISSRCLHVCLLFCFSHCKNSQRGAWALNHNLTLHQEDGFKPPSRAPSWGVSHFPPPPSLSDLPLKLQRSRLCGGQPARGISSTSEHPWLPLFQWPQSLCAFFREQKSFTAGLETKRDQKIAGSKFRR